MADDELRSQVNQNTVSIAEVRARLNELINEVVKPATETAAAYRQRHKETSILIQNLLEEARADRIEHRKKFDVQQQELRAQRQECRVQSEQIRAEIRVQQEVIQAMLVDVGLTHSRLDDLEAS
jgi:hypothetical protein